MDQATLWGLLPLLASPARPDKVERPGPAGTSDDWHVHGMEDKLDTLRNYSHVRGLYVRCGEKWSRNHCCPKQIQLHVLQCKRLGISTTSCDESDE